METVAAVRVAPEQTEIRQLPLPDIPIDAGLLKVEAAGICGSDVGIYKRHNGPAILGHENVGVIVQIGRVAAQRWGVQEGDRVAIEEYLPCGHCNWCHQGEYRHCLATDNHADPTALRYGSTPVTVAPGLWGGYSQYLYLPPQTVIHRVPDAPTDELALALPLGNGVQWACVEGGAGPGRSILIMGPGQQGLGCVVAAKAAGASPVIVSGLGRDADRLEVARKLGADAAIDVEAGDLRQQVADATGGEGVDAVVDTASTGSVQLIHDAVAVLKRKAGVLVWQGSPAEVEGFPLGVFTRKYATLRSCRGHSYQSVELALRYIGSRRFPLGLMCTHRFGLAEVDTAIRSVGGAGLPGVIHATVDPWQQ
ncbi:MAG TPA: zinc-binding dehydrogenase [Chloroflexota bacterium]